MTFVSVRIRFILPDTRHCSEFKCVIRDSAIDRLEVQWCACTESANGTSPGRFPGEGVLRSTQPVNAPPKRAKTGTRA